MSFIDHIKNCTAHNKTQFTDFCIDHRHVGEVRQDSLEILLETSDFLLENKMLVLAPFLNSAQARTKALKQAINLLAAHHNVKLTGEIYPVIEKWGDTPYAEIDRAAIPWFGTKGFGVHANGFVRKKEEIYLWIAKRDSSRLIDPNKLDNMVGGGLPLGLTIEENLAKEAWEEAGLDKKLISLAISTGSLSYKRDMMKGVRRDTLFTFDLEMPDDITPACTDGEVESFTLMPAQEVAKIVEATDQFKFNCNLVLIDFFLRHNIISTAHKDYDALEKAIGLMKK